MTHEEVRGAIGNGNCILGLELGSTRIKAVLIGEDFLPVASGAHDWENRLEDGVWSYRLEDVRTGIQAAYRALAEEVQARYGCALARLGGIGISAMMHGYLPFDAEGKQLVPFRTWRNTITGQAAALLTERFGFNIPQRWSIAHLYQAMLNKESHVKDVAFLTTLAGYVHWQFTGEKVLGVGDASGMFPIGSSGDYDPRMMDQFDALLEEAGISWRLREILPQVKQAGEPAGVLTEAGARLLDPTGTLQPGAPLCPPEGDAGTGMTATNSVAVSTGNVSAGTSVFAMVVLDKPLSRVYPEIDMVTTPSGKPVAMVHCNTCTSDLDAWVGLFGQAIRAAGGSPSKGELYELLYRQALEGDADCGGLLSYNYYSGEPVTGVEDGTPLFLRPPQAELSLPNFMRAQIYAAIATLKLGMDLLVDQERVKLTKLLGHGGLFKTRGVGQRLLAGALGVPVAVRETAGEGGPWGMALLAAYGRSRTPGESLEEFLQTRVFVHGAEEIAVPDPSDASGFAAYIARYRAGLPLERSAAAIMKP